MNSFRKIPHTAGVGDGGGVTLGSRQWWIYPSTSKRLPLSRADCHTKGDFDRKSYYAQFEGNVEVRWTQLNRRIRIVQ